MGQAGMRKVEFQLREGTDFDLGEGGTTLLSLAAPPHSSLLDPS